MIVFVTKTILLNLLNFVSNDQQYSRLSLSTLDFIRHFIREWIPVEENSWSSKVTLVVKEYLNIVVEKLVTLACKRDELGVYILYWCLPSRSTVAKS